MCIWEIISPKGCFTVISTPDAKNACIKIVILTKYMYNDLKLPNDVIRFRTFRFWLRWETWAGGCLRGLLLTLVRKFKVEIWRSSLLFLHKFTTAQQLLTSYSFKDTSNCDAFKREIYVNTKLHNDGIYYPRK